MLHFQESLTREKSLEDKLIKVKGMISKNIGRSQTDLMRAFEDIKQEIMSLEGSNSTSPRTTSAIDEIVSLSNYAKNEFLNIKHSYEFSIM